MLADARQKLASAKGHADVGLENQAKELLAQEREKQAAANVAALSGQTVVQAEDQLVAQPGEISFENVSIDSNMAGSAADPLVQKDGRSIISEGMQTETGDAGEADTQAKEAYDIFKLTPELENHIKYVDMSVPRNRGIGGAHNSDEFLKNDINVVDSILSKDIPGVTWYKYNMPLLGKDGKPIGGYGKRNFYKTVYDPKVFPHSEYTKRGLEAVNDALRRNGQLGSLWEGYDSLGIKWVGYGKDGIPTSFFPDIPIP